VIENVESLVDRAVRGDAAAVERLLRDHYDLVRAVCHRIVINASDAEDATQHAMISIARALPRFDHRSKFSTWAYRIATNAALDEIRRTRRRPRPVDDSALSAATASVDSPTDAVVDQLDLESALEQVTPEYRQVLVLRHVADLDYADIADTLGLPIGTVRSRLARGRAQLMDLLGNHQEFR
jgi:RNA polymerase sigma-70 factor (ECF subfamily)